MTLLRVFLTTSFVVLVVYMWVVVTREGWGLLPVFLGDIAALTWRGHFNLDFFSYLILSAVWLAWRSGFSRGGVALAVVASVAGMTFLAPVLMVLIARANGDMRRLLLGVHAD